MSTHSEPQTTSFIYHDRSLPEPPLTAYDIFRILNFELPPFSNIYGLPRPAHEIDHIATQAWNRISSGDKWVFAEREKAATVLGAAAYEKAMRETRIVPGLARDTPSSPTILQAHRSNQTTPLNRSSFSHWNLQAPVPSPTQLVSRTLSRGICMGWHEDMPSIMDPSPTLFNFRRETISLCELELTQHGASTSIQSTLAPRSPTKVTSILQSPTRRGNTASSSRAHTHAQNLRTIGISSSSMPELAQFNNSAENVPSTPQPIPISTYRIVPRKTRAQSKSKSKATAISPRRYVLKRNHVSLAPSRTVKKRRLNDEHPGDEKEEEGEEEGEESWPSLREFLDQKRNAAVDH